jgi:ribosomal protein S6
MQKYELTVVLPGGVSAAKKKTATEKIEKLVTTGKGKVVKLDEWGKIDLAYKIKKEASGFFLFYELELEGSQARSLNEKLSMDEGFIRYLLIRKDK